MIYIIGFIFILFAIWQLVLTWRTFKKLKKEGNKDTSSFIMLAFSNSLLFVVVFLVVGISCLFF
ncbi:conserved hypothetical protein [Dellaglioa algida]|uniref:Uncharacterized protein n=1 Tax=Dellaglioa algida TaxID=105612 RepID=A0A2C8ELF7_9LACO|nr:hypothetical protein LABALGLTS371_06780 [Dellaglioa algida]SOB49552.1 conserved hypothetical protein [Dellaglioa algida]